MSDASRADELRLSAHEVDDLGARARRVLTEQAREARVSFDMIYDDPRPGDRVLVESVLGVVDRVRRWEA